MSFTSPWAEQYVKDYVTRHCVDSGRLRVTRDDLWLDVHYQNGGRGFVREAVQRYIATTTDPKVRADLIALLLEDV